MTLANFLTRLLPPPFLVSNREKYRAVIGSAIGIALTALISHLFAGASTSQPWLVAPIGASAVLVFALPSSPLAQPWPVIGGTTLSALVGAACAMLIPDPAWAGPIAVALAIGVMFALRCLHPPGGASALLCALGGVGLKFVLFPVLVNCLLIVIAGMVYNTLTGRRYPHALARETGSTGIAQRFSKADLDAALTHYNEVLDINRDDLEALLHYAEAATYQRRFGDLRCKDIMSPDLLTAQFGTPLAEAWTLMRQRHVKALPVVDKRNHIIGIVTVADFMRHAGLEQPLGIMSRLKSLVAPSGTTHSEKPEVVGQIMTRAVRVSSADRHLAELVPLFSEGGHHHIPIIDGQQKAVGIITQTDLVKALYKAAGPTTAS